MRYLEILENFVYFLIVFALMGECAVGTDLYLFAVFILVFRIPRAVFKPVQGTVAEKAVYFFDPFMAGIVFTIRIFKKLI